MKTQLFHGLLAVDKPGGMTSRQVVDRVQCCFPRGTRLGHTGTLDPLATGLLILCVGVATRLTEYVQNMSKTYQARLLLGARSDTDDADGAVVPVDVGSPPAKAAVWTALNQFIGEIEQVPPAHSAAKVAGRRAYLLARRGQPVTLAARKVKIYGIDILSYAYPRLEIEVRCGKGTYLRSLARDLGERLGSGALIETLRRTRVGPFGVEGAMDVSEEPSQARARLLPLTAAVADLPQFTLTGDAAQRVRHGQAVALDVRVPEASAGAGTVAAVLAGDGTLLAIVQRDSVQRLWIPVKVFHG
jgi:tRNA pseudouridine55 synthase